MIYSFTGTSDPINETLIVSSTEVLDFIYQTIALAEKADVKITGSQVFKEKINNQLIATAYDDLGVQSNYYDNTLYLTKKPMHHKGVLTRDFGGAEKTAIGFAIVCAAKGILADLKGLEIFAKEKNGTIISLFQKELYRFNVNTDFCDHSKLKIFNTKEMSPKTKPVNFNGNDFLSSAFIPLSIIFGKIEIELPPDFETNHGELIALLPHLHLNYKK